MGLRLCVPPSWISVLAGPDPGIQELSLSLSESGVVLLPHFINV